MEIPEELKPIIVDEQETPTLGAFAAALAKAQGEMEAAKKDSLNPHFKSKYANLASVIAAIQAPLSKNGLARVQRLSTYARGARVRTRLIHSSGEWMEETLEMPAQQMTAQGIGSAASYGRRYGLESICGLASEDDDGNEATKPVEDNKQQQPQQQPISGNRTVQAREKAAAKVATLREQETPKEMPKSNEPDPWALIYDVLAQHKIYGQKAVSVIKGATGKTERAQLTLADYEAVKASLGAVGGILAPKKSNDVPF